MKRQRRQTAEAKVDMTAMLDIVFILLIFFVVTSTFQTISALDINTPPESVAKPPNEPVIVARIDDANNIRIGMSGEQGLGVDIRRVRARFEQLRAANPEAPVVIQPADDTFAGIVIRIIDQARQASINPSKISVVS